MVDLTHTPATTHSEVDLIHTPTITPCGVVRTIFQWNEAKTIRSVRQQTFIFSQNNLTPWLPCMLLPCWLIPSIKGLFPSNLRVGCLNLINFGFPSNRRNSTSVDNYTKRRTETIDTVTFVTILFWDLRRNDLNTQKTGKNGNNLCRLPLSTNLE